MASSFITTNPEAGKKTALKLLNKYADSFNCIKEENKLLKMQIQDLSTNIKINKSIIEGFFNKGQTKQDKENICLIKMKEENQNLYKQNNKLQKLIEELNEKISIKEQSLSDIMSQTKEENENLKTKLFLLEQSNEKKNNIISQQKSKLSLYKNGFVNNQKEIYVTNPSKIINEINNELIQYKESYYELKKLVIDNKTEFDNYEKKIVEIQNENQRLRQEYKLHIFSTNKERETLMTTIQRERSEYQCRCVTEDNVCHKKGVRKNKNKESNKNTKYYNVKTVNNINENTSEDSENSENKSNKKKSKKNHKKKIIYGNNDEAIFNDNYFLSKIESKQYEHEDFIEILRNVGLNLEKYEKMTQVKSNAKFIEIIEMLLNLVKEKENVIKILKNENDNLNANNFKLNKNNMILYQQNMDLKSNLTNLNKIYKLKTQKDVLNNITNSDTLTGDINDSDLKTKIKKAMHIYKEYLNTNQKENISPTDDLLDMKKIMIESSIEIENSFKNKNVQSNTSNGLILKNDKNLNKNNLSKYNSSSQPNILVKPILEEKNEQKYEINKDINNYINNDNNKNNIKKIPQSLVKNSTFLKSNIKNMGTLISVTSSEFREGCPGVDSFLSTMKFDETKKNIVTNGAQLNPNNNIYNITNSKINIKENNDGNVSIEFNDSINIKTPIDK